MNRIRTGFFLLGATCLAAVACGQGVGADGTPSGASTGPQSAAGEKARIRAYLDERYTAADVRHSFHSKLGETIDCVDFFAQGGVKELARRGTPITELPAPARRPIAAHAAPDDVAFDGSLDEEGNARACSDTTVPFVRWSIDAIEQAGGLDAFIAHQRKVPVEILKPGDASGSSDRGTPGGGRAEGTTEQGTAPDGAGPTYGHAQAQYNGSASTFTKTSATLAIWDPTVSGNDHSLAQTWTTSPGGLWSSKVPCSPCVQTVEVGWTVDHWLSGQIDAGTTASQPHIFVYSTANGYQSGCYDGTVGASLGSGTCPTWVGLPGAAYAVGQALPVTVAGANPTVEELTVQVVYGLQGGNASGWGIWVAVNSTSATAEIGYYASSSYTAPFNTGASTFIVGGEVDDISHYNASSNTDTFADPMGSGSLASAGWGSAAYAHDYSVTTSTGKDTSFSAPKPTVAQYATWTAPLNDGTYYSPAPGYDWANFFYFGEAGAACTPATCSSIAGACGQLPDGCGNVLDCGSCGAASGCDQEYVPPGYGTVGYETVETVSAPVETTSLLQLVNGSWVPVAPFTPNLGYPGTTTKGEYVIGVQSQGVTTSGAPIGFDGGGRGVRRLHLRRAVVAHGRQLLPGADDLPGRHVRRRAQRVRRHHLLRRLHRQPGVRRGIVRRHGRARCVRGCRWHVGRGQRPRHVHQGQVRRRRKAVSVAQVLSPQSPFP